MKNKLEKILGFEIEATGNPAFGDYTANVAMVRAKSQGINPHKLAEELTEKLKKDKKLGELVEKIEVAGPGFINFWLKTEVLVDNLMQIGKEKEEYGKTDPYKEETAIVEYSSANIAKPFTIGHLRSTIIGDAIANLLEFTGWKVLRDNHLGDWGTQFGKQIYAIKTWGKKDPNAEYSVKELVELYVKFHEEAEKDKSLENKAREWFKKLEDGNTEAREIWKKCVEWSFKEFDRIYDILRIKFSKEFEDGRGLGESFFENRMKPVIAELRDKKLLKKGKEGAELVFFENDKYPPAMIIKKDGATLYHTRDLATDKYRLEKYNPDLIINEVGMEQKLYFEQLFEMERMLGWFKPGQRVHVGHGLVRFKEGKMSTRKGNVVWMEDVLNESLKRATRLTAVSGVAHNIPWGDPDVVISQANNIDQALVTGKRDEDIKAIAIGALKYNDLKRDPRTDIVFDWDEILNMEGNSGPYLQYTIARCNSVIAKSSDKKSDSIKKEIVNDEELSILRALIRFGEVTENSAKSFAPNLLCNYLFDLAQTYNSFYATHRILSTNSVRTKDGVLSSNKDKIIGSDSEELRVAITFGVAQVLKNGLKLLGIESPERM